jgi:hypothetical protein
MGLSLIHQWANENYHRSFIKSKKYFEILARVKLFLQLAQDRTSGGLS